MRKRLCEIALFVVAKCTEFAARFVLETPDVNDLTRAPLQILSQCASFFRGSLSRKF